MIPICIHCKMIDTIILVTVCHQSYEFVFLVIRTFKIYALRKFQTHSTIVLKLIHSLISSSLKNLGYAVSEVGNPCRVWPMSQI